jgi:hypothetical protein
MKPLVLDLGDATIRPVEDHAHRAAALSNELHRDGHFYPSAIHQVTFPDPRDESKMEPVPKTSRPAHLFYLPPSHRLTLTAPVDSVPSTGDASFLVQLLAYLYGTRLQLDGFQFDGRVPVAHTTHHIWLGDRALATFVDTAYQGWRAEPADRRLRLTNILYMHSKAPSYDWTWEQYLIEYLVTDAIYDYCVRSLVATPVAHADRIFELCRRYGLHIPSNTVVEALVRMRNELFHEAQWQGERPGYRITIEAHDNSRMLRSLNQRLIAAALGGANAYATSSWEDWRNMCEFK